MSNPLPPNDQDTDKPLSPEALAVLGKARRSFGISIGIMLLGFMAIGFALVYRAIRDAPPPPTAQSVSIPQGAQVLTALNVDGSIQVTYRAGDATILSVFDAETGALLRSVEIGTE